MLTVFIVIAIWAILGITYALIRDLEKFDIPISTWIILDAVLYIMFV